VADIARGRYTIYSNDAQMALPSRREIVWILRKNPFVRLRDQVHRVFIIGSYARGAAVRGSDLDMLVELEPRPGVPAEEMNRRYREVLQARLVNYADKPDEGQPKWRGRRIDPYFTYDADTNTGPKVELAK
jgi:predicted nucleotidyltransferase